MIRFGFQNDGLWKGGSGGLGWAGKAPEMRGGSFRIRRPPNKGGGQSRTLSLRFLTHATRETEGACSPRQTDGGASGTREIRSGVWMSFWFLGRYPDANVSPGKPTLWIHKVFGVLQAKV